MRMPLGAPPSLDSEAREKIPRASRGSIGICEVAALEQRYTHALEIALTHNAPIDGHSRIWRQDGLVRGDHGMRGVIAGPKREQFYGKSVCCVVTGGSVDPQTYARLITDGDQLSAEWQ